MNTSTATVLHVLQDAPALQHLQCALENGSHAPAVLYSALAAPAVPGDSVLLNTTAVDLGLGTGGVHFVIANLSSPGIKATLRGHILKLRYTPLQTAVLCAEAPESPYHHDLAGADNLHGMPVVCCEVLSQAPGVLAGMRHISPGIRVAVVVTDEASLPAAFSNLLASLREAGLVLAVITAGQAFGGDLEAVNVYSGLLAARHALGADAAIVTPGPGVVGTGTVWGCSAVAQGQALNAVHSLGGRPVAAVRASTADHRPRHRGVSHHAVTALARAALCPFEAGFPAELPPEVESGLTLLRERCGERLSVRRVEGAADALDSMERAWQSWLTMGRTRRDDPVFYETAAASGIVASAPHGEGMI